MSNISASGEFALKEIVFVSQTPKPSLSLNAVPSMVYSCSNMLGRHYHRKIGRY